MPPMALARSSSGGVVICYALPVLWMTPSRGASGPESSATSCLEDVRQVAVLVGRQTTRVLDRVQGRRHSVDWGGHVHPTFVRRRS